MTFLAPVLCLILGVIIGILTGNPVKGLPGVYLGVAALASLDTIFGGLRSSMEGKFHTDVFITGFIANVLIAAMLAWIGDRIGANIFMVCALIFGTRIFNNLSLIRRFLLTKWQDSRERKRQAESQVVAQAQQQQQAGASS
jgi:small basic protein